MLSDESKTFCRYHFSCINLSEDDAGEIGKFSISVNYCLLNLTSKFLEKYICTGCEAKTGLKTIRKCEFLSYFYKFRHVFRLRMYFGQHLLSVPSCAIRLDMLLSHHADLLRSLCTYLTILTEAHCPSMLHVLLIASIASELCMSVLLCQIGR